MGKSYREKPLHRPSVRRVCRIVADKRGNASTEWIDAPPDFQCPTVEIKRLEVGLSLAPEKVEQPEVAYDPYSNPTDGTRKRVGRRRTNLRQLSEEIKAARKAKESQGAAADDDQETV